MDDGRILGAVVTFTDITERKRTEAKLLQQQIEQQVLLDLIPAMVWYKDTQNRILRVNRAAAALLNKDPAEMEGQPTSAFYPEEAEQYYRDDLDVIASGRPKLDIIELLQTASGEKRWIRTDKVPYRDKTGTVIGVLVVAQDITERKRAEDALRRSEATLNRAQGVAHIGSWHLDVRKNELAWTDEAYRIFDVPPGTPLTYERFLEPISKSLAA